MRPCILCQTNVLTTRGVALCDGCKAPRRKLIRPRACWLCGTAIIYGGTRFCAECRAGAWTANRTLDPSGKTK